MSPYLCTCDKKRVVVKFAENIQGPRGLVNEYVAFEIAKILDLPTPECFFIKIPTDSALTITTHDEKRVLKKGIAFGSEYIDDATAIYNEKFIADSSNKNCMFLIILFDHLLYNVDRNSNLANTLYQSTTKRLFIIDHERIFGLGNIWDIHSCKKGAYQEFQIESFDGDGLYGMINRNVNLANQVNNAVNKIKEIKNEDLEKIIANIPDEWGCDIDERQALLEYIKVRISRIDELAKLLKERIL